MASERGRALALGAILALALVTSGAHAAAPTAAEKETARAMMDQGHTLREAGDHQKALVQFQGADAIMHVPTTGLEVAREQVALGLLVEARDTLQRILRTPATSDEPTAFRAARANAAVLDEQLVKRIAALQVSVTGAPGGVSLQVYVDTIQVPSAALVAPFKVNPGHHVVSAAAGDVTAHQEVDVPEGQTASVVLALSDLRASVEAPSPGEKGAPEPSVAGRGSSAVVPWLRWGGVVLAAAGVGVGSVTGAMSISKTSATSKLCVQDRCGPQTWSDIDSAHSLATISTISFVGAGVGAALAIVGFALGGSSAPPARAGSAVTRHVVPWVGPGSVGVDGTF
jgi:hypothetical protein